MKKLRQFQLAHETAKQNCMDHLASLEAVKRDGKLIRVTFHEATPDRTIDQNSTSFMWYGEIAKQTGETAEEVHRRCKLDYGIPILRRREDFEAVYERCLIGQDREQQLEAMKYIDVTSIMSVREMGEYMDAVYITHTRDMQLYLTQPKPKD